MSNSSKKFCVIGKRIGSSVYQLLTHDPLDIYDATSLQHSVSDFEDKRIHHWDNATIALNSLNKNQVGAMDADMLKTRLEDQIRSAIFMYSSVLRTKPVIQEIFVGHENYEVEVTFANNTN